MAKLVDAQDLKSWGRKVVPVQVRLWAFLRIFLSLRSCILAPRLLHRLRETFLLVNAAPSSARFSSYN
jgi:hypothetical protein